jgi:hypothetical protein
MSPIVPLLMLFLLICRAGAAELPPDAQVTIDREAAQEAQLKTELDAKVAKLHSDLVARLKKSQDAAMHRGDLDGAEAIKARIVGLQGPEQPEYLLLPAEKAAQTTDCTFDGADCPNVLSGGVGATCSYQITVDKGSYYLYGLFTAATSRPCELSIDGVPSGLILKETTGSWNRAAVQWVKYGPYELTRGDHMLLVKSMGYLPNIRGFAISKEDNLTLSTDAFDKH